MHNAFNHCFSYFLNQGNYMRVEDIQKVAVIGFGTMGSSIAQIFAQAGYEVIAHESHQSTLNLGLEMIENGPFGLTKLSEKIGKTPIVVNKDVPGFVANRIGFAGLLEAIRLCERNVSSAEDIDKAMKFGYNWPQGPLELADLIGLDVVLDTSEAIYKDTGDHKYGPPIILKQMVKAGLHGRKTGKGFYKY